MTVTNFQLTLDDLGLRPGQSENKPLFTMFYQTHHPKLVNYCYGFVYDWQEAHQYAQDIWLRFLQRAKTYIDNYPATKILYGEAYRCMVDAWRQHKKRPTVELDPAWEAAEWVVVDDPLEQIDDLSLVPLVLGATNLSPRERLALKCDLVGYTTREGADHTGLSLGWYRLALFRARQKLRKTAAQVV